MPNAPNVLWGGSRLTLWLFAVTPAELAGAQQQPLASHSSQKQSPSAAMYGTQVPQGSGARFPVEQVVPVPQTFVHEPQ
jgi:hypothetical protein